MKVKVRFIEGRLGQLSVLEVATPIEHPLSRQVNGLLGELGLRVVHAEQQRGEQRLVQRWVLAENSGQAIDAGRRSQVQAKLLEAMGSIRPPAPSEPGRDSDIRALL